MYNQVEIICGYIARACKVLSQIGMNYKVDVIQIRMSSEQYLSSLQGSSQGWDYHSWDVSNLPKHNRGLLTLLNSLVAE